MLAVPLILYMYELEPKPPTHEITAVTPFRASLNESVERRFPLYQMTSVAQESCRDDLPDLLRLATDNP
uniref:Uncharacterized protein n=1 Tax=Lotus japonicus TaxID=34305 RepID=I3SA53_LOTJA|nr:unknown [Lotus japonicus]